MEFRNTYGDAAYAAAFYEAAHPVKPGPSRPGFSLVVVVPNALEVPLSLLYALSLQRGIASSAQVGFRRAAALTMRRPHQRP